MYVPQLKCPHLGYALVLTFQLRGTYILPCHTRHHASFVYWRHHLSAMDILNTVFNSDIVLIYCLYSLSKLLQQQCMLQITSTRTLSSLSRVHYDTRKPLTYGATDTACAKKVSTTAPQKTTNQRRRILAQQAAVIRKY